MSGITQLFRKAEEKPQQNKDLVAEFEALKAKPIQKADEWTIVNSRLIVGCGCGGGGTDIHIALPGNHPGLKDDVYSSMDDGDLRELKRQYPDAVIMRGHATPGVTDHYSPGDYEAIPIAPPKESFRGFAFPVLKDYFL